MPTLDWIGKKSVVKHHMDVPYRLLETVEKHSHGDDDSGNLLVQGDNLLALKALLPRYAGRVKCIYIDPPYNTGNEGWVYNDNVNSPEIKKWLGDVVGKEAEDLGRHDKWLCMMYPRLLLLKQFLHEEGVIFVSIDDNEVHHLRLLMDEIFGLKKRLSSFVWRTDGNFDNQAKVKNCHEYVLAYCHSPERFPHPKTIDPSVNKSSKLNKPFIRNTIVKNGPKNPVSEVLLPKGFPADFNKGVIQARQDSWPHYEVDVSVANGEVGSEVVSKSGWSSKNLLLEFINNNFKAVKDTKGQSTTFVMTKTGAIESIKKRESASHVISVISGVGSTQSQSVTLEEMDVRFTFPKPVDLVKYLISIVNDKDCIVLDSFSGSGTTGEAVLKQNVDDGGDRKFILIEMDENTATNTTASRIKKVCTGFTTKKGNKIVGVKGGFQYCNLSNKPLFDPTGQIRSDVTFPELAEFVWFIETGSGYSGKSDTPLLGVYEGRAIYLLYNGILKDHSINGGNVLTTPVLDILEDFDGSKVIYAAACRLGNARMSKLGIQFKHTPYALEV